MKILHVLCSNRFSGAENVVCQIIDMFQDEPDVKMVYCSPDGQIRESLKEHEIAFTPLKELSVAALKQVIQEQRPDVIHAHDMRASFYAAGACGKIPLISHIHNNNFDSRGVSPKSVAYLFAAHKARHIFWVSQSSYEGYAFHSLFQKKSSVLYNIIDVNALYEKTSLDTNEYDYDITYIGRLTPPKNPQRLMNVFRLVIDKKPNVKIAVIGTGELEAETKALAQQYDLLQNVDFLGFQSNPLKILYDSRVMAMTSRWEGTPMCALEAMALGVPIVSTPVDGLKDLVINGENGYLSDDDIVLAEKLLAIVEDEELHDRYSDYMKRQAAIYNDMTKYKKAIAEQYRGSYV